MGRISDYKQLEVWQVGIQLASVIYRATETFPPHERLGLASQMRRAAVSIPSNIAEGYGRGTTKDYIYFLRIARGSAAELETQLIIARQLEMPVDDNALALTNSCQRMLQSLIKALSK